MLLHDIIKKCIYCSRSEKFFKKGHKIHNFCATTKFFTYFWGSTKFPIEWWGLFGSKRGGGGRPPAPPLAPGLVHHRFIAIITFIFIFSVGLGAEAVRS